MLIELIPIQLYRVNSQKLRDFDVPLASDENEAEHECLKLYFFPNDSAKSHVRTRSSRRRFSFFHQVSAHLRGFLDDLEIAILAVLFVVSSFCRICPKIEHTLAKLVADKSRYWDESAYQRLRLSSLLPIS